MAHVTLEDEISRLSSELLARTAQLDAAKTRLRDTNQRVSQCQSWEDALTPLRSLMTHDVLNTSTSISIALRKVATEVGALSDSGLRARIDEIARDAERLTQDTMDFAEIIDRAKPPA